jgi:hypothetical protein
VRSWFGLLLRHRYTERQKTYAHTKYFHNVKKVCKDTN